MSRGSRPSSTIGATRVMAPTFGRPLGPSVGSQCAPWCAAAPFLHPSVGGVRLGSPNGGCNRTIGEYCWPPSRRPDLGGRQLKSRPVPCPGGEHSGRARNDGTYLLRSSVTQIDRPERPTDTACIARPVWLTPRTDGSLSRTSPRPGEAIYVRIVRLAFLEASACAGLAPDLAAGGLAGRASRVPRGRAFG